MFYVCIVPENPSFVYKMNKAYTTYSARSMFVNNLDESLKNKATTSSTKLGLESSCSSSS